MLYDHSISWQKAIGSYFKDRHICLHTFAVEDYSHFEEHSFRKIIINIVDREPVDIKNHLILALY